MSSTSTNPLEEAVLAAFPWLLAGLVASLPLLLVPQTVDRRLTFVIHLTVLVAYGFALGARLARFSDAEWFVTRRWPPERRRLVTAASLIVIVTGVVGLVTLASSAAIRYEPSLQFLQLLSALDIAWVVAGTFLATRWLWGTTVATAAATMTATICILSIVLYLGEVGLDASGGWLVDRDRMLQLVIPFDVAAAVITTGLLAVASQHASSDSAGKSPVV